MKNILRVLKRDLLRLLKAPQAMVVIVALLILPSLYTWYNVLGFWNPYENTGKLEVCVVNEDEGAESDLTGPIDVGHMIVEELQENDQLDWQFYDREAALDRLSRGQCYAVFVIPGDFSKDLLSVTTGDFIQPKIDYYVNEKIGPVSPKITDTGANTLDDTINAAFVETVSEKAVDALDGAMNDARAKTDQAQSAASAKVVQAKQDLHDAEQSLETISNDLGGVAASVASAQAMIGDARGAMDRAAQALSKVAETSSTLQSDYLQFSTEAIPALSNAMMSAAEAYAEAVRLLSELPVQDDQVKQLIAQLRASADKAQSDAAHYADVLANEISPAFSEGLGKLSSAASTASGSIAAERILIDQLEVVLNDLTETSSQIQRALDQTRELLGGVVEEIDRVETDILALTGSLGLSDLLKGETLDAQKISEFISAPTRLKTEQLYPLNSYGAAMAPLFMNLTFWIGAFMLMVVLRHEADAQGIKRLTLTQRYLGRYLLFAIMVILQAVICCAGLPLIGVEIVNVPALFFAAIIASLAYLSIIYALSVTLQHIGMGICVILVFAQIPGATGLYPVEMTSPFFQAIYPLLPFTYGISAMRESICGFYGNQYASDIGVLLAFLIVFMVLGIVLRPLLSNVNRMVARQIKQSDIFNGEDAVIPARRYRFSQVLRVLADRSGYREALMQRYDRFQRLYPWLIRGAIIVGVVVPIVATVVLSLGTTGKVVLLTLWLGWIAFVFIFLVVIESLKMSFERQMRLDDMSDAEIRRLYLTRNATERADMVHTDADREQVDAVYPHDAHANDDREGTASKDAPERADAMREEAPCQAEAGGGEDA